MLYLCINNGVVLALTVKTLVCKHAETWTLARKSEYPKHKWQQRLPNGCLILGS
jgi:hypothetical protein